MVHMLDLLFNALGNARHTVWGHPQHHNDTAMTMDKARRGREQKSARGILLSGVTQFQEITMSDQRLECILDRSLQVRVLVNTP